MVNAKRLVAAAETLLIFPAVLFMTALFVQNLQPQQLEPAHTAQRIVMWYASHPPIGLWVLLIALPLAVLVTGGAMLLRSWTGDAEVRQAAFQALTAIRAQQAILLILVTTLTAGGVLAIVALHMLSD
jgi:hypothetical protein